MTSTRWTPIDSAAVATAVTAMLVSIHGDHAALSTVVLALIGAQGHLYGRLHREQELANCGAVVFVASLVALPFTTGLAPALQHRLAEHGISGTDLAVAVLTIGLLIGGAVLRSKQRTMSSWVAYGPGLVLVGLHLLSTQAATHQQARVGVAIGFGVAAIAVGGVRRLAAPLLLGTALVAATTVLATGHQLASLPVWTWLAVGGVVLLSLALLVERRHSEADEPVERAGGASDERLIDTIRRTFS